MLTDRSRIARPVKTLALCSSLAIATALMVGSSAARAQSFQGNGTFASGNGTITTGPGTTTINLATTDAVIDWTTFDAAIGGGPINFQPSGTTATFQRTSDFSVLNRILPTDPSRAVQFNGNIIAQIQGTSTVPGGSVYFYSPGGVIVGSTAVFNVGNLGLTSIAPAVVGGVFEQPGPNGEFVQFNGAVTPGSAVTIQAGAQITGTAPGLGSYLAIVAPRISNAGTVTGKRVSALVSADAATITLNINGLFDIQVTSGTSGTGATLVNTGSVTGPAASGGLANRIYLVAVPKNDAITMIIGDGSSLGFNIAGAADIVGNAVILSAGHDIAGGQIVAAPSAGGGSGAVMIDSFNAGYTSEVVARATGRALFASDGTVGAGNTSFAANLTAHSATIASLEARSGGSANVTGNLALDANASAATPSSSVIAGNAYIDSRNAASLTVGGNAVLVARAQGGNATGGSASATALTNGTINVVGVLRVRAEGIGGSGGSGTGGAAVVSAQTGGDISANQLNVSADGLGGADSAGSGAGAGGTASIFASGAGSTITVASGNTAGMAVNGDLDFVSAEAFGGVTNGGGSAVGGTATGGTATINVNSGATLTGPSTVGTPGFVRIIARGTGGNANAAGTTGGMGTGGTINIIVDNATMTSSALLPSAFAQGGFVTGTSTGVVNGGNAVGGVRNITVRNGGSLTTSLAGGSAGAVGGNATATGRGGDASGGNASLTVDNATFNVMGNALFFTQNMGGNGGTGGNATGGTATAEIRNGGVVNVSNAVATNVFSVSTTAFGGNGLSTPGTAGGNATPGLAQLLVNNGTLNAPQIQIHAAGFGGGGMVALGGNGTGGTARLQLNGATLSGGVLEVSAEAFGGSIGAAGSGNGGIATGGSASIQVGAGSNTLTFNTIGVIADAEGGEVSGTAGNGGAAFGGIAQINVTGGATLTVTAADTLLKADGEGGAALNLTGNGGAANAGRTIVSVDGGSATFNGNLSLSGDSAGGDGINGGTAFGDPENNQSRAFVFARNGSLAVTGLTALHAVALGGQGSLSGNGGNATGGFANVVAANGVNTTGLGIITLGGLEIDSGAQGGSATGTGNGGSAGAGRAHLFANGGTITVGGNATLFGDAIGGAGVNGGNAISARTDFQPRALIGSFNGTIDVAGATSLVASASGGSGRLGGTGGVAFAGQAAVDAQSPNGSSAISLGTLNIEASALGGFGGAGASGQAGGAGGDAYGGPVSAFGNAGRGVLTVRGNTLVRTGASGGTGGQGGGDETAPGAAGGAGGRAFGGALTVGTRSGVDTPSNTGSATFGQVSGDANALGGAGGAGGFGTTQGAGGAGGSGFGGSAGILVRGSPATFGDVTLTANGTGGNGGAGAVQGDGGDGYAGDGFVNVTQRFMRTERGSLTANNVNITSAGIGGTGATVGDTFYSAATGAESDFFIRQSNVTLANLVLTTSGALAPNFTTTILRVVDPMVSGTPVPVSVTVAAEPFDLAMADSTASIAGNFTLSTPGNMRVSLANSTLNVGSLTLSAGNFVLPATRPATLGTINVSGGLVLSSQLDFLAYANFNVAGSHFFDFGGSVLTGDLTFGGDLGIDALGSITTGAVTAGEDIDLIAGGTVTTGQLTAGETATVSAGGAVTVAGATAGIINPSSNPGAEYVVVLRSLTSISAGDLTARGSVGVGSPGSITVGNITSGVAGRGFLALAGTGLTTGSIDTTASPNGGLVYLANFSMEPLGGQLANEFNPDPILAATPVAIGGPITLNGAVSTGRFQAATTGAFTAQAITSINDLRIDAGGSITTGAITSGESIKLDALGAITTGQLTAGDSIDAGGDGPVSVAGASAGIVNPSSNSQAQYAIGLGSQTSLTAGNLTALGAVGVGSPGTVSVGNIVTGSAGFGFLALAGTGLTTGSIDTTGSANGGQVYLANWSMESLGADTGNFNSDVTPILAATPVAIGGPITLNGAVSTGRFQAATTGAFTAQAITAPNLFQLAAGAAVTLGDLTSFTINVSSGLSLTLGAVTSTATSAQLAALNQTNGVTLTAANGALATGAISSNGSIDLIGALALTTGAVNVSGGSVEMDTNGALLTGAITSGQSQRLFAGTTATTGNLVAGNNANSQFSVGVAAGGAVTTGNVTATRDIGLLSQNSSVTAGNIGTATNLGVLTRGAVTLGSVTTGTAANNFLYIANASLAPLGGALGPNFNPAPIFAATPVATTGPITIRGPINTGNLIAATTATLSIGSGPTPTDLSLAGVLNLAAGGALALGNVNALGIRLQSGSTIAGGALTSREAINVSGAGAITLGNLSAGIVNPTTSGVDKNIGVVSTGSSLTVGTVAAGTDVGLAAGGGNLTAGTIMAGDDVLLLARDAVSVGSITAGAADGRILIANASLRSLGDVVNDVDPDPIFNAAAAPVTGAITIGGPVTGTTFSAAAIGNFTAPSLTLGQRISIARAALAQVDGAWVAPTIGIASQKLQFGTATGAGIGGTGTTSLTLRALASGQQAVFGGTTQGSGYTLTQSDFARIRTSNLTLQVDAQGVTSTTPDLEIRDLTLTGSAGSGSSAVAITTPGSLRVVGDLLLSQAGAMDTLAVTANRRLELVLPDGSIAITGAGGALAGTLTLSSDNLVAGTLTLLQQIMADPEAAGLADALKTPASTTSNLSGYIRASGVKLLSNANILLQNSGTARDFAGVTVGGGGLIIGRITPATGGTTGGTTGGGTTTTSGFSFTGMLVTANDILMFEFRVDAASTVTLRTYSYAGGTNQAGQAIPAGGFDPILALFDAAGALINQNDDGGSNVPADPVTGSRYDTFLTSMLAPGNYKVSVSVFSNFAIGPNLSNGFEMNETDFGSGRTANFAFDVLGAATATGPGSQTPSGPLNVIGFGRQIDASGQTVSGNDFFAGINFGTGSEGMVEYNAISQFNTCFVNGACQGPSMPDADPVAAISSEITVITGSVLDDSPVAPTADDSDEGDESGSNEPEDEDNADDEGSSPIAPPTPLISTRALDGDVTVVEPVSGAGNPALYGSAVNETTVEGETP